MNNDSELATQPELPSLPPHVRELNKLQEATPDRLPDPPTTIAAEPVRRRGRPTLLQRKPCLMAGCANPAHSRGLCSNHYYVADRLVKKGKTTWRKLQNRGLASLPTRKVKVKRKGRSHVALANVAFPTKKSHTCLVPDCGKKPYIRGLCNSHYPEACKVIQKKKTTWDKLVAAGKALPPKRKIKPEPTAKEKFHKWLLGK